MKITSENKPEELLFAWEKSLEDLNQENALLKYRLSEIVDENEDEKILQMAEYFQNELLLKDEMLKKLIKTQQQVSNTIRRNATSELIKANQQKLKVEILQFQKDFHKLAKDFDQKLVKKL
jgi:hypothetical protein